MTAPTDMSGKLAEFFGVLGIAASCVIVLAMATAAVMSLPGRPGNTAIEDAAVGVPWSTVAPSTHAYYGPGQGQEGDPQIGEAP